MEECFFIKKKYTDKNVCISPSNECVVWTTAQKEELLNMELLIADSDVATVYKVQLHAPA